jgi:cyclohexa-1,5-dienecarbonyl-CoA hydratase
MSDEYSKIRVEPHHEGAVWRVVLDSPKGNVLDSVMMADLHAMLGKAAAAPELRLVVYEGAGKHFCFGASVEEHTREKAPAMLEAFHGLFLGMTDLSLPFAALVRGQCLGGGMELAAFCHFLFAESTAVFGQPEIKLGVFPPPASVILPLRLGQGRAEMFNLAGESVPAGKAYALGLVSELVPETAEGWAFLSEWAGKTLVPLSASSLRFAVRAGRAHFDEVLRAKIPQVERLYLEELMATEDANEGIGSFLEKRRPAWKHR